MPPNIVNTNVRRKAGNFNSIYRSSFMPSHAPKPIEASICRPKPLNLRKLLTGFFFSSSMKKEATNSEKMWLLYRSFMRLIHTSFFRAKGMHAVFTYFNIFHNDSHFAATIEYSSRFNHQLTR